MFERLIWEEGRGLLGDLVFVVEERATPERDLLDRDYFILMKGRSMLELYEQFFARRDFRPRNIMELGIWDGGSSVLWFETFWPKKLVAIDISVRGDAEYFARWKDSRNVGEHVATHWGVDQADADRLREIVRTEFDSPPDLVIDDASHLYGPTKASFETLFPLMQPGALYIIEDWSWEHCAAFAPPDHPWAEEESLTRLLFEAIEAAGSGERGAIATVTASSAFVAIERGWMQVDDAASFTLEDCIVRRSDARVR
jgi:hypothetical protein